MDLLYIWHLIVENILHLDKNLLYFINNYGNYVYLLIFIIVFCETGVVFLGFLPGDSLLFTVGTISAFSTLNPHLMVLLIFIAAVVGDFANFSMGYSLGTRAYSRFPKIFKKEYMVKTQSYYEKYGNKTIVIARFVPIVRSFAPFVAGVGRMKQSNFVKYNIIGAAAWTLSLVYLGYFFGNTEFIKKNNGFVILSIIVISAIPIVVEIIKAKFQKNNV